MGTTIPATVVKAGVLSADTTFPIGTVLPTITLSAGLTWPDGFVVPVAGQVLLAPVTLIKGAILSSDVQIPAAHIVEAGTLTDAITFPVGTVLPAVLIPTGGVILPTGTRLPAQGTPLTVATTLPKGSMLTANVTIPLTGVLQEPTHTIPAGALKENTLFPAGTKMPSVTLPAGVKLPPNIQLVAAGTTLTMPLMLPKGTVLAAAVTLPATTYNPGLPDTTTIPVNPPAVPPGTQVNNYLYLSKLPDRPNQIHDYFLAGMAGAIMGGIIIPASISNGVMHMMQISLLANPLLSLGAAFKTTAQAMAPIIGRTCVLTDTSTGFLASYAQSTRKGDNMRIEVEMICDRGLFVVRYITVPVTLPPVTV